MSPATPQTREPSPRQRLLLFADTGRLRDAAMNGGADSDVADLVVTVVLRYCEPRRRRRVSP